MNDSVYSGLESLSLVPLKKSAVLLGLEPQTIRNRMSLGRWPIQPVRQGRRVYFLQADLEKYLKGLGACPIASAAPTPVPARRRGAPTAAERSAARAAGFTSVPAWRAAQQEGRP